jgi:copper(I)-binding protein
VIASRPSRSRRGGARLAAAAALLAGAAAVSSCSAGQLTQTASQVPAVPGNNANGGANGEIALRNLLVAYNGPDGYPQGGSAPLVVRVFNGGQASIALVGASVPAEVGTGVVLVGAATTPPPSPAPPATPEPTAPAASPEPTPPASPGGSPSPLPGATPSPQPSASPSPGPAGGSPLSIPLPPGSYALLVPGQGPYLEIIGLERPLLPGSSVPVTFTFSDGSTVTVAVPFGLPSEPVPRASAEIHPENGE